MTNDANINFCFPCGHFSPNDPTVPFNPEIEGLDSAVWPSTARLFWDKLKTLRNDMVCAASGASLTEDGLIQVDILNEKWCIDSNTERTIKSQSENAEVVSEWDHQIPFLLLVYLVAAQDQPISYDMISPRDLVPGVDIFTRSLKKSTGDILKVFGKDAEGFLKAAEGLGGSRIKVGDASVRFHIFPKVVVDYILWQGDEEFPAKLTILIDKSAIDHLALDAIAVAVNLLSRRLNQQLHNMRRLHRDHLTLDMCED